VLDEHVIFFEAAGIEQNGKALAGSQAALGVLGLNALLTAAEARQLAPRFRALRSWLPFGGSSPSR
jgi:hypothetical protein